MKKIIVIIVFFFTIIGCKTTCECVYIEPEYETEVVDFGGLIDEQCYTQCGYYEYQKK